MLYKIANPVIIPAGKTGFTYMLMQMVYTYIISVRAGNGIRTRDPQLGKLMLYQLSYSRIIFSTAKIRN
jgi:hypothetical protein